LPRFLFDLYQKGPDDSPYFFTTKMQAYNVGEHGDMLSINSFGDADCAGDATSVSDGGVTVRARWGRSRARFWTHLADTNMCDIGSI
jgi:hypothetical protein